MRYKSIIKILLFAMLLAAFILLSHYLNFGGLFAEFRVWVRGLGYWGPFIYILFYMLAVTALFPGSVLTIAAGAIFGSLLGIAVVSAASTLGAGLSFLISRYFARDIVERWARKQDKLKKLDELVRIHGESIVAVTRLIPLFPYTLLNYGFGLTKIPFKTYIFWSWLCMLPGTVLYVVGTDAVVEAVMHGKIDFSHALMIVVALILIGATVKYAKKILARGNSDEV